MQEPTESNFNKKDEEAYNKSPFRQYGVYSSLVFQMLGIIGLAFWGGKKLNDYWHIHNNLLTVGIGFLGLGLALYNTLRQLKNIEKNENSKK